LTGHTPMRGGKEGEGLKGFTKISKGADVGTDLWI